MSNLPTFLLHAESQPMLFIDCPFCLAPLPVGPDAGSLACESCRVELELAPDPLPDTAPVAAGPPLPVAA
jgi:hypothetical protein